ncbi:MAG: PEGA domain-containing protein [Fibrobacteres bacterium]|nr:PEGA domain-containing protein [Fibrobacterota bacterium]
MKNSVILHFLFLMIISLATLSAAETKPNIAVIDLTGAGLSADDLQTLSNRLRTELFETQKFIVVERGQMEVILKEQGFQQTGCTDAACAVEAGQLLNVEFIVLGSIDKIGRVYSVNLRSVSVKSGEISKSIKLDFIDKDIEEIMLTGIRNAALQLAGLKEQEDASITARLRGRKVVKYKGISNSPVGSLNIIVNPSDAEIVIDDSLYGKGSIVIDYIPSGAHKILIRREGYRKLRQKIEVIENQETPLNITLIERTPFSITVGTTLFFRRTELNQELKYSGIGVNSSDTIRLNLDYKSDLPFAPLMSIGWDDGRDYFGISGYYFPGITRDLKKTNAVNDTFYLETNAKVYGALFDYAHLFRIIPGILTFGPGVSGGFIKRENGVTLKGAALSAAGVSYAPVNPESFGSKFGYWGGPTLNLKVGYKHLYFVITDRVLLGIKEQLSEQSSSADGQSDNSGQSKFSFENTLSAGLQFKF